MILDTAGAKGTGKWMSQLALDLGVPSTLVTEAVYARCLSAMKDGRVRASKVLKGPTAKYTRRSQRSSSSRSARRSTPRRFAATPKASCRCRPRPTEHDWPLNYGDIALLWRGGCIIRAVFLERIKEAFDADPKLENLLLAPYFAKAVDEGPGRVAARRGDGRRARHSRAGVRRGAGLLRRLPPRPAAGQSAASPARLLRRPHLRAHRQARRVPHRLDSRTPHRSRRCREPSGTSTRTQVRLGSADLLSCPTICKNCSDSTARWPSSSAAPASWAASCATAWRKPAPRSSSPAAAKSAARARVAEIEKLGGKATLRRVDVADRESVKALLDAVVKQHGRVDMLVNCAGVNSPTPYLEVTDEDLERIVDTNLRATHWACQIFGKHMVDAGGGAILNIGSVTSYRPLSRVFAYSASKAAVLNLTQNVAREFAPHGVRVNCLCPGFFPGRAESQDPGQVARRIDHAAHADGPLRRRARADRRGAAAALARGRQLHHRRGDLRRRRLHGDDHSNYAPTHFVIFGALGRSDHRKLVPALYHLFRKRSAAGGYADRRLLANRVHARRVAQRAGQSRRPLRRQRLRRRPVGPVRAKHLLSRRRHRPQPKTSRRSPSCWAKSRKATASTRVYYLATAPQFYEPAVEQLGRAGLADENGGTRRVVIEKPFGTDLASAQPAQRSRPRRLRRAAGLSHRPLPGQRNGAEPAGAAVRQHDLRADLEPQLHRPRANHRGRRSRRRPPRRLLRHGRRRCATCSRIICCNC